MNTLTTHSTFISIGHLIVLPIILYGAILGYKGIFHIGLNFVIICLVGAGIIIHARKLFSQDSKH